MSTATCYSYIVGYLDINEVIQALYELIFYKLMPLLSGIPKKDELDKTPLQLNNDISKMTVIRSCIGDRAQPLTEFDEVLFDAMV